MWHDDERGGWSRQNGRLLLDVLKFVEIPKQYKDPLYCRLHQHWFGFFFPSLQEDGYIIYQNHMSSSYEVGIGPKGSITRDSHFECVLNLKPFLLLVRWRNSEV